MGIVEMVVPSPPATSGPCLGERCPWLVCYSQSTAMDVLLCASPGQAAFSPDRAGERLGLGCNSGRWGHMLTPGLDQHFHRLLSVFLIESRRLQLLLSSPFLSIYVSFLGPNNHIFHFPPTHTPCSSPASGLERTHKCHWSQSRSLCWPA